jgi:lipid-A-disaccharide synthase-like uncharacterized protein
MIHIAAIWITLGWIGQALFGSRFLLQWIYSEHKRRSLFPMMFWYFSISGGALLLAYAIYLRDPVFIVGQSGGLLIYLRNLHLRLQERKS